MSTHSGIRIAVVGLRFGACFVPIYRDHPDVEEVVIFDPDEAAMHRAGDEFGIRRRFTSLDAILADSDIDAVHLVSPVPNHVEQTVATLSSGKHCACAVPMATDLESLQRIVALERESGKNYMMMETAVYTREFLLAKELHDRGDLGKITFLRGTYYQDLEGSYPTYWRAQPPMHYGTHAIGPVLALAQTRASRVHCFGSGTLRPDIQQPGGNTFPLQTAIFRLAGTDIAAEVTRSWFQVARPYTESFSIYGDKMGFEWQQIEHEDPLVYRLEELVPEHRGRGVEAKRTHAPERPDLLPAELAHHIGGWHGGSHPHLVHEFVRSIVEGRRAAIDSITAADWTAPGICANESALREGEGVDIPIFG
jgi:predicted dehydrogenase